MFLVSGLGCWVFAQLFSLRHQPSDGVPAETVSCFLFSRFEFRALCLLVSNLKFRVSGVKFRASGFWFLVSGFWFLVSGFEFGDSGFRENHGNKNYYEITSRCAPL